MKREAVVISILIIIIVTLYFIRDRTIIDLNLHDGEVAAVVKKTNELKRDNAILREKVLYYQSLTEISSEAISVGFVKGVVSLTPDPRLYELH